MSGSRLGGDIMDLVVMAMAQAIAKNYTDAQLADLGFTNLTYHFCTSGEYNATSKQPTVSNPNANTFYFTPGSTNELFNVYYNKGSEWTKFTTVTMDLSVIPTDDTLSKSGFAADSKKVGDEISSLKEDLKNFKKKQVWLDPTNGEYVNNKGKFVKYNGWTRTKYIEVEGDYIDVEIGASTNYCGWYNEQKGVDGFEGILAITRGRRTYTVPNNNVKYFVISAEDENFNTLRVFSLDKSMEELQYDSITRNYESLKLLRETAYSNINTNFITGRIDSFPTINKNIKYRICSENLVSFDCFTEILARTGFEFALYYTDGTSTNWLTYCGVNAGTEFKIEIRKTNEDTSITADIEEFRNGVYISDFITEKLLGGRQYVLNGIERIVSQLNNTGTNGNLAVFGFSTDQHIYYDYEQQAVNRGHDVLTAVSKKYPIDFICLGGDACHEGNHDNSLVTLLKECIDVQEHLSDAWCPIVPITGNHDAFQNNANMTGGMLFNAHFKRIANSGFIDGWDNLHTNGYWDSAAHKIRFVFFDSSLREGEGYDDTARRSWLQSALSSTPEDYGIIVFSHHPLSGYLTDSHWYNKLQYHNLLKNYGGDKIICCISGHEHIDVSEVDKNNNLFIGTTMAKYGIDDDGVQRVLNTEGETAVDIFAVDTTNKRIYSFRYGYGNNRVFDYDRESPTHGEIVS